ncbi:TetR/AcrR family transcriptional regulator [Antrihabitans sp. YC3-6]|uniref:TetR/AcrR family transcriptional regulator n=1 Tax=Antrihabitans stalagmiti TaxID=2799499 RepID=A0A934NV03_9NOCA|nr:TetR/AcrR family transcriptional regulator [Antrihabitans stalagmiti]MBJ8342041.1 TetR/AcrR family transcriptional regulator [Antrihabitans stalagmiti]
MTSRKALNRNESRELIREELLDAAERLFVSVGYHGTSVAAIVASAGRTVGAVYSNFANKEDLCFEVIKRRGTAELSSVISDLAAASDDLDARVDVIIAWWSRLSSDSNLLILGAEYLLVMLRDTERQSAAAEAIDRLVESARALFDDHLPHGTPDVEYEKAVRGILATATGLSVAQAAGVIDTVESTALLLDAFQLRMARILDYSQPN